LPENTSISPVNTINIPVLVSTSKYGWGQT